MYFRGKACSKNNFLLERVDSRVQYIWRLLVMGSWPQMESFRYILGH